MVQFANVTGPHPETGSGIEAPCQFFCSTRKKKKRTKPGIHTAGIPRQEKGTVKSTAVANAGRGAGSSSSEVVGDNVVPQNEISQFCRTHLVPIASAYLSPYVRESCSLDKK